MDRFLSDTEIKDQETAESLEVLVIANRVARHVWKAGFIGGCLHILKKSDTNKKKIENVDKREKHIVNLKTMVILLSRFFSLTHKTKPATIWTEKAIENKLEAAVGKEKDVDVKQIKTICNAYEKQEVKPVIDLIDKMQQKHKSKEDI
jgi:hypothetical protein